MKKLILILTVTLLTVLTYAQEGIDSVIVEQIDASEFMDGATTYRVFVDLTENYELQRLVGTSECALSFSTTTTWYNLATGGISSDNILDAVINFFPEVASETFISLGGATSTSWAVLYEDDTDGTVDGRMEILDGNDAAILPPAVNPLGTELSASLASNFGALATDNSFVESNNGQYFSVSSNANITPGNRIMIGQFTTDGEFSFALNVQTAFMGTANGITHSSCEYPILTFPNNVGIEDFDALEASLVLYPNPAQNEIFVNFELEEAGQITFDIMDISGRIMNSTAVAVNYGEVNQLLNTEYLESGMYILRITDGKNSASQRFSIAR